MNSKGKTMICCDKKWEDDVKEGLRIVTILSRVLLHHQSIRIISIVLTLIFSMLMMRTEDYADDVSDYGGNDDFLYEDDYSIMQSNFDNADLPPGVEVSIPWLKDSVLLPSLGKKWGYAKFLSFKHFDVVDDFSDHHYRDINSSRGQPKEWVKQIQEEWKILEKDLPETIYVRVYEGRMDLLRAIILGPAGTPYHDGLFVFECFFPSKYPHEPPMVYYYSGGLRLNPNLYKCGKVCLSLLGTWPGDENEMWVPGHSTMLQVLVSIQALILNARPFFNEPGYESSYLGDEGEKKSRKYNEEVFILSLKTMIYTLRKPPKHFEDFVTGHFRNCAHDILVACQAYGEGATIGSVVVKDGVLDPNKILQGSSEEFKGTIPKMINVVAREFVKNGSTNCKQFQAS
ncbi:putative ubiquitin-conjugating enzyme E2 38 [Hibiscus syriacus]|uniref:putative ubiquitin-conjugating enzyme E2 38 n=1 Tax=Hibiscus syriacus TaxID=106335 RepID=UPI0019238D7E|nr:putative ubiquitin-conjugating enzyme E2 38 [Hibiscus syriacus]